MSRRRRPGPSRQDVVILGAGLAGLSLARQLLRDTDRRVLLLERRDRVPPARQKVGEATVQVSGYYFSRVLGMEHHLQTEHYMKYNLRFLWPTPGAANDALEHYSQAYIRTLSNIASYQLDRNKFEAELLRVNRLDPRFTFVAGVRDLEVELSEEGPGPHRVTYASPDGPGAVDCDWVVDTTGRNKLLAKRLGLTKPNPIRHGSFFWWVDGLLDIEELTDLEPRRRRLHPSRRHTGHLPFFLATNHFLTEGAWFWVIPLHGRTSLGLVFDRELIPPDEVMSVDKATRFVCERFPALARELPHREAVCSGGLKDFSYDCQQTISPRRWALAGEAGRFTDPLYSPGGDLIAIYNTLIVDAVVCDDEAELAGKCQRAEQLMRSVYAAYEPSYAVSYDALGDPEVFTLKYGWELSVYFSFYVFPFINDLHVDRRFQPGFLRQFAKLGPINHGLHQMLSDFYQWKKARGAAAGEPVYFDFMRLCALREAEKTFYEVGVDVPRARRVLAAQASHLEELARYIAAWIAAAVLGEPEALTDRDFVAALDPARLAFEPDVWQARWDARSATGERYPWRHDVTAMAPFRAAGVGARAAGAAMP